jgi:DNA-binding CsgD family transcriptional regulator
LNGLSPRHDSVALLALLGVAPDEIANALGLDERQVRVLVTSPLFRQLAESGRAALLAQAGAADATALIDTETLPSLRKIVKLRDEAYDERIQLRASQDLLDRNPATARISKGRSLREVRVSEQVASYVETLTGMRGNIALPTVIEGESRPVVVAERLEDVMLVAESDPWP